MSVFNLTPFNINAFLGVNGFPTPSSYQGVKIFGKGKFSDIHGISYVYTQTQIDSEDFFSYSAWGVQTFLLGKMEGNTQGGNITSLPDPITSWLILRRGKNEAKFTTIDEIGAEETTYVDRTAKSKETYIYQMLPKSETKIGLSVPSLPTDTDFKKIIIEDTELKIGYYFCLDLQMSNIQKEEDIVYKDTRGKFQTEIRGNKKVNTGSISFLANSSAADSEEFEQDLKYLEDFERFIENGNVKLLKFPKGYIYKVSTSNFSKLMRTSVDNKGNTLFNLSFSWREIGEVI